MQMAKNRIAGLLLCLLMLVAVLPERAYAIDPIDLERETTLTVWFHDEDKNLPGVRFDLYRVADSGRFAEFTLTGEFSEYPVVINDLDAAGWKAAAETLAGYVQRDKVTPLDSGTTGEDGKVTFPTGEEIKLMPGLYLVVGAVRSIGGYRYMPQPLLISLPNRVAEEHQWSYDVTTSPKYERKPTGGGGPGESTLERKVLKVWDDGDSEDRPESIQVQLLKNGEVMETVTLSAENNWRYTWSGLNAEDTWQVVEKETPEGYTVTVGREGITFVMTNTKGPDEEIPEEPTPEGPTEPPEELPDEPTPTGPTLPQTGQLWWPVPVLACAGMLLFLLGWARKEKAGREE